MNQVFISYRQTSDAERSRVRDFAARLRSYDVDVILDQFLLDEKPAGPAEGWDKWSSDRASQTEHVIIIGSESWFQCFDKKQAPGTGLGAACEADDLRHRIYDANGIIENIRVVLFDDADTQHIVPKLKRYHRFHFQRDFSNIVRWLGGFQPDAATAPILKTTLPHNLPTIQPFFGREEELRKIADALDPDSRTWGALIDGPGGMGKTSLAVRAAYDASPEDFQRIVFVSLKSRELDDDGVRDLSGFLISGLSELFNELSREIGRDDIPKASESERPLLLLAALRGSQTLLVLDNLESLLKRERDTLFTFVKKLPTGCKAILTSRGRIGSGAEELILEKLSEPAALSTLAELAKHNPHLARTSEDERLHLYRETGGKPLLLRWTAGQIGRGHCLTLTDALNFLRSCPTGNDPLEFIFGDLVDDFSEAETKALCALTYFTLPTKVKHIAAIADLPEPETNLALRRLVNRSLAVPNDELSAFSLVPMVADFLRKKKPELIQETGSRLEDRAFALILENGFNNYDRFPTLEAAWPSIAPALSLFLAGDNQRLQIICAALKQFLNFQGHWDERLTLSEKAEACAIDAADFANAGWRAYDAGYIRHLRQEADAVLACAERAADHWQTAKAGIREKATAIRLRGLGYRLKGDYPAAIAANQEVLDLFRSLDTESYDVALALNDLAESERRSGNYAAAEKHYQEALRIARAVDDRGGVATYTSNLVLLALDRRDWQTAETLAREALSLSKGVHRNGLIASDNHHLATALLRQGKAAEALPHAQRAVEIFTDLGSPVLAKAQAVLAECRRSLIIENLHPGWTYNTTTLEGNTLTLEETRIALADSEAEFPNRPKEHVAMTRNQAEAEIWLANRMQDALQWSEEDLFQLHTILMKGSAVDIFQPIGAWKNEDNGTSIQLDGKTTWNDNYSPARNVRDLMLAWLREFNKRRHGKGDTLDDHIYLHASFVRIHPFADGNGRMARLLANVPILAANKIPVNITPADRERYLESLARWQIACGPPKPNEPLLPQPELLRDFSDLCGSRMSRD